MESNQMTPPTPAAVRAVMKRWEERTPDEWAAYAAETRHQDIILRDHIRAIAAEMRAEAKFCAQYDCTESADTLFRFADKLEGKQ
jgi:hypothetical protein